MCAKKQLKKVSTSKSVSKVKKLKPAKVPSGPQPAKTWSVSVELQDLFRQLDDLKYVDGTPVPESIRALAQRSGFVAVTDPISAFLYLLMRDYITAGDVEEIMLELAEMGPTFRACNGYLAHHSNDVASRLRS